MIIKFYVNHYWDSNTLQLKCQRSPEHEYFLKMIKVIFVLIPPRSFMWQQHNWRPLSQKYVPFCYILLQSMQNIHVTDCQASLFIIYTKIKWNHDAYYFLMSYDICNIHWIIDNSKLKYSILVVSLIQHDPIS